MESKEQVFEQQIGKLRSDVDALQRGRRWLSIDLTDSPMTQLTVDGTMSDEDYELLCLEVQQLADDVAEIRAALLYLVDTLRI